MRRRSAAGVAQLDDAALVVEVEAVARELRLERFLGGGGEPRLADGDHRDARLLADRRAPRWRRRLARGFARRDVSPRGTGADCGARRGCAQSMLPLVELATARLCGRARRPGSRSRLARLGRSPRSARRRLTRSDPLPEGGFVSNVPRHRARARAAAVPASDVRAASFSADSRRPRWLPFRPRAAKRS